MERSAPWRRWPRARVEAALALAFLIAFLGSLVPASLRILLQLMPALLNDALYIRMSSMRIFRVDAPPVTVSEGLGFSALIRSIADKVPDRLR